MVDEVEIQMRLAVKMVIYDMIQQLIKEVFEDFRKKYLIPVIDVLMETKYFSVY